jgi:Flp pilus assembly protein TadG
VRLVNTSRRARARGERGAAAVEFALVLPFLLLVVFGIIDYGLYFNNSINVRQGVREAARQAVVGTYSSTGCTTGTQMQQLVCTSDKSVGAIAGTAYSKVVMPATWARGNPLIVCSQVKNTGTTGFVPLPASGYVRSRVQMSIEADVVQPTGATTSETLPAGGSWAWCS